MYSSWNKGRKMLRDLSRALRCLASIPMLFWATITAATRKPAGQSSDAKGPQDPGHYFADDPWVE